MDYVPDNGLDSVDFQQFMLSLESGSSLLNEDSPQLSLPVEFSPNHQMIDVSQPPPALPQAATAPAREIKRRRPRWKPPRGSSPERRRPRAKSYSVTGPTPADNSDQTSDNIISNLITAESFTGKAGVTTSPTQGTTIASSPNSISSNNISPPTVTYNFINNELVLSKSRHWSIVQDPATRRFLTRIPDSTLAEIQSAVTSAQTAFKSWRDVPFSHRRSSMLRLLEAVRQKSNEFAICICTEAGKTMEDATTEVLRSLGMIESACSVPNGAAGSHISNDTTEMHTITEPLGVCLSVTPFNFPLMIPLWSVPFAIISGNTVVLKPSEYCPTAAMLLANCFIEAEFPPGVLSVIHGGPSAVDKLLAQPSIQAVSFVGSDLAAERVYQHAIATRKRIQADCGSKNHGVVVKDATKEQTLYAIAGSAFGAAGQRCMALSVVVFVGETASWLDDLVRIASSLKVSCGSVPGTDIGPLITPAAKARVEYMIQSAVDEGATLLLDGRNISVVDYRNGNFVGPTILTDVKPYMQCYQTEIFGPVLSCLTVDILEEAIDIINENRYGNGCSIFTTDPVTARTFQRKVNVGQIGVNVPVLVSPGQLPRTSNKDSFMGDSSNQDPWQFFTMTKTITSLWRRPW